MNPDQLFALFRLIGSAGQAFTTGVEQGQEAAHIQQQRSGWVRTSTAQGPRGEMIKDAEVISIRKDDDDADAP